MRRRLRGRHAADRWDKQGLDEAVTLFRQALDHDATSAEAAAQLALALESQGEEGFLPSAAASEQARHVADVAVKLDPKNPSAHFVLGMIHIIYDWDWAAAGEEAKQVSALAPSSAEGPIVEALRSVAFGRSDDALMQINASLARDPLHPGIFVILSWIQTRRGHLAEAEAAARRTLEIRPTFA
jgi:tetratricopeptide (TPR) repeat protein